MLTTIIWLNLPNLPMLKGEVPEERGIGWVYNKEEKSVHNGYAFRYGGGAAAG